MESSGISGEIQVTTAVYERLKEQFVFKKRGSIPIKGKGEMTTYLLLGSVQK
jgi:class 3 adenylate cyclase